MTTGTKRHERVQTGTDRPKCLHDRCFSPTACEGFGYCRDLNIAANARKLLRDRADLLDALELFERQWNACGPNSDFGRYFQNVRDAARAAIAAAKGE